MARVRFYYSKGSFWIWTSWNLPYQHNQQGNSFLRQNKLYFWNEINNWNAEEGNKKKAKGRNRILFSCTLLPMLFFNILDQFRSNTVAMNKVIWLLELLIAKWQNAALCGLDLKWWLSKIRALERRVREKKGEIEQNKSKSIFCGLDFPLYSRVPQQEGLLLVWLSHLMLSDQPFFI